MGALFGKQKKSRVTEQDKAVLQLKQQRDKLKQYQRRIEGNLERDRELARKLLKDGKKDRVKLLLRKKKYQENLLATTDGQLENLEKLTHDLEFATIEIQVVKGLKAGNEALKKVNAMLSIDDIERILEETREGIEKQREIDELLSGGLTDQDEEDVLAELEDIIKEQTTESLPDVPSKDAVESEDQVAENLPDVPDEDPQAGSRKKAKLSNSPEKVAIAAS